MKGFADETDFRAKAGKTSMKEIFGKKNVRKDGSEGKVTLVSVPHNDPSP